MESDTSLLQAGFSVDAPGLEDGEHVEEIGFVVRRLETQVMLCARCLPNVLRTGSETKFFRSVRSNC